MKRGFSLIEFVIYIAITSFVLLFVQHSVMYFRHQIDKRVQHIHEQVYVERGLLMIDKITSNAVSMSISTSTNGFEVRVVTYLTADSLNGYYAKTTAVHIMCSLPDKNIRLFFESSGKTVPVFVKPYIQITSCELRDAQNKVGIESLITSSNKYLYITTARSHYTHPILTFSEFLEK